MTNYSIHHYSRPVVSYLFSARPEFFVFKKYRRVRSYTSKRLPIEVVFVQPFGTRDEAFIVERQIKKWNRRKKEALIENN